MPDHHSNAVHVRTPEGISFSYPLASPIRRVGAWAIDRSAVAVAWSIIDALIIHFIDIFSPAAATTFSVIGYFVFSTFYGIILEWCWEGQTLGKRVLNLRVMDERFMALGFGQVVLRNVLRIIDSFPFAYLLGGAVALASRKSQRLGDIGAATIVVDEQRRAAPRLGDLEAGRFNSLRRNPYACARLRSGTSPALADAALRALQRRDQFSDAGRVSLFGAFSAFFREAGGLRPEDVDGLTDEQIVRNAVGVLFEARGQRLAAART